MEEDYVEKYYFAAVGQTAVSRIRSDRFDENTYPMEEIMTENSIFWRLVRLEFEE